MHYLALVTGYDGTIANGGVVDAPTLAALERSRGAARRPILVIFRGLTSLQRAKPRLELFEIMAPEKAALLYDAANHEVQAPVDAPPGALVECCKSGLIQGELAHAPEPLDPPSEGNAFSNPVIGANKSRHPYTRTHPGRRVRHLALIAWANTTSWVVIMHKDVGRRERPPGMGRTDSDQ